MTNRPAPVQIDAADLALLDLGRWQCAPTDRRSKRLAKLRLCESIANEQVPDDTTGQPRTLVHWRTTAKGALLVQSARIAR